MTDPQRLRAYYSHRVFADADAQRLSDILGAFLVGWTIEHATERSDYETIGSPPLIRFVRPKKNENFWRRASFIAAAARSLCAEGDYFQFTIVDLRWANRHHLTKYSDYPLRLRQEFQVCPNFIEVSAHRRWYSQQKEVGQQLARRIQAKGVTTFIHTLEGDFIDIINSAYVDPADAAEEIHRLARGVFAVHNGQVHDLPLSLAAILPHLDPDTVAVLQTAEALRAIVPSLPDVSVTVIEYCKALEIELKRKLQEPLRRQYLGDRTTTPGVASTKDLRRMDDYVSGRADRPLELGTLARSLSVALKPAQARDPIARAVREYLAVFPNPTWMTSGFAEELEVLVRRFRNPAAHGRIRDTKTVEECRRQVLGDHETRGLLHRLMVE